MCLKTCGYFFCWSDQVKMGHAGDVYTHFTTSLGMPVLSATYLHPQLRQIIFEGRKKSLLLGRYECRWPPSWLRSSEKLCRKLCLSAHRAMWYTSGTNPWAPTASESIISEAIHCPKLPRIKRHGFKVMVWKMYLLSDMPLFWGIYVRFQGGVISEVMFVLQRIMHNKISGTPATLVDVCVHGQKKETISWNQLHPWPNLPTLNHNFSPLTRKHFLPKQNWRSALPVVHGTNFRHPDTQRLGMIHGDIFVTLIVLPRTGGRKIFSPCRPFGSTPSNVKNDLLWCFQYCLGAKTKISVAKFRNVEYWM